MSPFHDFVANVVIFFAFETIVFSMHGFILIKFWNVYAVLLTALPVYDPWKMCLYSNFVFYAYKPTHTHMHKWPVNKCNVIILWYGCQYKQQLEHMMFNCAESCPSLWLATHLFCFCSTLSHIIICCHFMRQFYLTLVHPNWFRMKYLCTLQTIDLVRVRVYVLEKRERPDRTELLDDDKLRAQNFLFYCTQFYGCFPLLAIILMIQTLIESHTH